MSPAAYEERIRLLKENAGEEILRLKAVLRELVEVKGGWICDRPDCRDCNAVRRAQEVLDA